MPQIARMAKATLGAASATLYTAPATGAVVKEVLLCNTSGSAATATIALDSLTVLSAVSVAAGETKFFTLSSVLPAATLLTGLASVAGAIQCYVSGVEL